MESCDCALPFPSISIRFFVVGAKNIFYIFTLDNYMASVFYLGLLANTLQVDSV